MTKVAVLATDAVCTKVVAVAAVLDPVPVFPCEAPVLLIGAPDGSDPAGVGRWFAAGIPKMESDDHRNDEDHEGRGTDGEAEGEGTRGETEGEGTHEETEGEGTDGETEGEGTVGETEGEGTDGETDQ